MKDYTYYLEHVGEYGTVEKINFPLLLISGLSHAHHNEMVLSQDGQHGVVFAIAEHYVEVLMLSQTSPKIGVQFTRTNEYVSVPTGEEQLGWVINPLGEPLMGTGKYDFPQERRSLESEVKGISERARIKESFETGVNLVDMSIPLGKGQKELIVGDKKTGKTAFVLNVIKNQAQKGAIIVYAAIGHRKNDIKKVYEYCIKEKIIQNTVIVAASSDSSPSLIYLTPFSAMSIAEFFRDKGKDVLVILDDLSTHARFYREISLIAQHFPGRESYPGDIFYNHARLLERAGNYKAGDKEVSITCLPVVETVEGDLSSYIPTNVMGMTDGHIYFDNDAFYKGLRPAINSALSVTRVGKQTQNKLQREVSREISLFLNQYDKLQSYSHFGAELSTKVQKILQKGEYLYAFFQQDNNKVLPNDVQMIIFGLIWSQHLENKEQIAALKNILPEKYQDKITHDLIKSILKVDSLDDFLTNISVHKDEVLRIISATVK